MKIKFYPSNRDVELLVPPPKPAATYIPDWYKEVKKFSESTMVMSEAGRPEGLNIKSCVPFVDGMMNGYIQETWQDIIIQHKDNVLSYSSQVEPENVGSRGGSFDSPIGRGFYQNEFVWKSPWIPRVPKGYSIMFTHPVNHVELPFVTATGIVDADRFFHSPFGNLPFYVRFGFTGIIPKGTPMYQMIPVKRNSWKSEIEKFNAEEQRKRIFQVSSRAYGAYKNLFHTKKVFR